MLPARVTELVDVVEASTPILQRDIRLRCGCAWLVRVFGHWNKRELQDPYTRYRYVICVAIVLTMHLVVQKSTRASERTLLPRPEMEDNTQIFGSCATGRICPNIRLELCVAALNLSPFESPTLDLAVRFSFSMTSPCLSSVIQGNRVLWTREVPQKLSRTLGTGDQASTIVRFQSLRQATKPSLAAQRAPLS